MQFSILFYNMGYLGYFRDEFSPKMNDNFHSILGAIKLLINVFAFYGYGNSLNIYVYIYIYIKALYDQTSFETIEIVSNVELSSFWGPKNIHFSHSISCPHDQLQNPLFPSLVVFGQLMRVHAVIHVRLVGTGM